MKLVFLIGSGAVGKMTVGQELMKRTGLRLFHNHMTIEPVIAVFGNYNGRVVNEIREIWNLPPVDGGDERTIRGEYYTVGGDQEGQGENNGEE